MELNDDISIIADNYAELQKQMLKSQEGNDILSHIQQKINDTQTANFID